MGIFDIFKRSEKQEISTEIVNPRDDLVLPQKEELTSDEINLLNKYKEDYLNRLKGNVLSSLDLEIDTLNNEIEMFRKLISNIIMGHPKDAFLKPEEITEEKNKEDLIIKARKLIIYLNDILKIKRDAELKLIALEEIRKEHKILRFIKRNALQSKISSLVITLHTFNSTGRGLILESLACIQDYRNLTKEEKETKAQEKLNLRKKLLIVMLEVNMPLILTKFHKKTFETIYEEIAFLEHLLEIEVYKHKDVLQVLINKIKNINIKDANALRELEELEFKLRIFYEFGQNLVTDEMFQELYNKKFLILTKDIMDCNTYRTKFRGLKYIEQKCYEEIIAKKLEKVFSNQNSNLESILKNKAKRGMTLISQIFNLKKSKNLLYDILLDRKNLAFLLSFDSSLGIESFFKNFMVSRISYELELDFEQHIFTWTTLVPYETICKIAICEGYKNFNGFYEFYSLMQEAGVTETEGRYCLPEGLVSIAVKDDVFSFVNNQTSDKSVILKSIKQKATGKTVYTPITLTSMYGDIFKGIKIETLFLNEGFRSLKEFPINNYEIKTVGIPYTFDKITDVRTSFQYASSTPEDRRTVKHLVFTVKSSIEELRVALINSLRWCFEMSSSCCVEMRGLDTKLLNSGHFFDLTSNRTYFPYSMNKHYLIAPLIDTIEFTNYGKFHLNIVLNKKIFENKFLIARREVTASISTLTEEELDNMFFYIKKCVEKEYKRQEQEINKLVKKL